MGDKHSESLRLQDTAMNLLATGYTMKEVAEVLGVAALTVETWRRRNPAFRPIVKSLSEQVEQRRQQQKRRW